jgi:hypothetical protein
MGNEVKSASFPFANAEAAAAAAGGNKMKFLKKLLYLFLLLLTLLLALVFACAWKPGLTEQLGALLYGETAEEREVKPEEVAEETAFEEAGQPEGTSQQEQPAAELPDAGITDSLPPADTYIAPELSKISVPEAVAGRCGYEELQEEDSEVEDEQALKLEEQLGVGETGDGLSFDALFYPYYNMLDDAGQHVYRQIYANARACNPAFAPIEPITAGKLRDVISAVYNDHPELFWLDTVYGCKRRANGQCLEIDLQFNKTAKNLDAENAAFENAAQKILQQAQEFSSDYDKERYVHDAILDAVEYSTSAPMNQSAYSALVGGRTVCAGYARAVQYLLQQLGIPCYYCTGFAGEAHAWNIVRLDDGFYNVDATWDDTGAGTYDYFNKTDRDYASTHVRQELSVNLPPCDGEAYRTVGGVDENGLRNSADLGFSESDVLRDLPTYYADCSRQILEKGLGEYTFENVIEGEDFYQEWKNAYQSQAYQQAYMVDTMRQLGAKSCHLGLETERLSDNRFLISHTITLQ